MRKLFHRRLLDLLNCNTNSTLTCVCGFLAAFLLVVIALELVTLPRSIVTKNRCLQRVSPSDSQFHRPGKLDLIGPWPIDAVYTWVNGSDPVFQQGLLDQLSDETSSICSISPCFQSPYALIATSTISDASSNLNLLETFSPVQPSEYHATDACKRCHASLLQTGGKHSLFRSRLPSNWTVGDADSKVERLYYTFPVDKTSALRTLSLPLAVGLHLRLSVKPARVSIACVKLADSHGGMKQLDILRSSDAAIKDRRIAVIHFASREGRAAFLESLTTSELLTASDILGVLDSVHLSFASPTGADSGSERNRFEDNEELRYSLRSISAFAPWLRRVYLVTNGQVPAWLNLSHPRISVVTHEEIFPNKSDLPTFNAPAIETHLHRIPGLSDHFLYFNDDVFLTRPVHPHEFYSPATGYRIFQSWTVPNCADGCPHNWIGDKACDLPCNVSQCDYDGGDCLGGGAIRNWFPNLGGLLPSSHLADACAPGCQGNWLADGFCDQLCDRAECGFDSGDCGLDRIGAGVVAMPTDACWGPGFHSDQPHDSAANLTIVYGTNYLALNLTKFWPSGGGGKVSAARSDSESVRSASLYSKFHSLHLVVKGNSSATVKLQVNVSSADAAPISCSLMVHFSSQSPPPPKSSDSRLGYDNGNSFHGYAPEDIQPKLIQSSPEEVDATATVSSLNRTTAELAWLLNKLETAFPGWNSTDTQDANSSISSSLDKLLNLLIKFPAYSPVAWQPPVTQPPPAQPRPLLPGPLQKLGRGGASGGASMYEESLKHTNRVLNSAFGFLARRVPAHMPHFISSRIVTDLQNWFPNEYRVTSGHRFRAKDDMQFSFAYFAFLSSRLKNRTRLELLHSLDVNRNGRLDRFEFDIATVRSAGKDVLVSLEDLENEAVEFMDNCVLLTNSSAGGNGTLPPPRWHSMSIDSLVNCTWLQPLISPATSREPMYPHQLVDDSTVWFKMLSANYNLTYKHLQQIVREPRKFLCLNDDLDHSNPQAGQVKRLLRGFLEASFPVSSEFELTDSRTNEFGYLNQIGQGKSGKSGLNIRNRKVQSTKADHRHHFLTIALALAALLVCWCLRRKIQRVYLMVCRAMGPGRRLRTRKQIAFI